MTLSPLRALAKHLRTSEDDVLSFGESSGAFSVRELVKWKQYEDFATDFCDFVEAVKNESINKLKFVLDQAPSTWRAGFWLFNTLGLHLPNAKSLQIVQDHQYEADMDDFALLLSGSDRFEDISLHPVKAKGTEGKILFWFEWGWLKPHSKLQRLKVQIAYCSASLVSMAEALMPLSSLQEVIFRCHSLTDNVDPNHVRTMNSAGAVAAFFQRSSLRLVKLNSLIFTNEAILAAFAQGLSASLIQDLTLRVGKHCSAPHLERICEAVVNCSNLRKIKVPGEFTPRTRVPFPLARLLHSNQELSSLKLGRFEMQQEELQALDRVLRDGTRHLTTLCLDSAIPCDDVCLLLAAAKEHTCLERLQVKHTSSSPEEQRLMHSHLEALCDAPCLRNLSVGAYVSRGERTKATAGLCAQLAERFSQNFALEYISIDWLDNNSRAKFNTICRLNRAGRRYLLSGNPSAADAVEVLAKHSHWVDAKKPERSKLDYLYTHLREIPGLCSRDRDDHSTLQDGSGPVIERTRRGTKRPFEDAMYTYECFHGLLVQETGYCNNSS